MTAVGLVVTVVERDPVTAVLLTHNCPSAEVVVSDITGAGGLDLLLLVCHCLLHHLIHAMYTYTYTYKLFHTTCVASTVQYITVRV